MKRPQEEDFKVKYVNGVAETSSVTKQYSRAQDDYIDYLEDKIKFLQDNSTPPIILGKPRVFLDDFIEDFEETIRSCIEKAKEYQYEINDLDIDDGYFDQWVYDLEEMLHFINEKL